MCCPKFKHVELFFIYSNTMFLCVSHSQSSIRPGQYGGPLNNVGFSSIWVDYSCIQIVIAWYITISLTIFKIASNKQYFSLSAKDTQHFEPYFLPRMNEYQFWICCRYEQISRKFHTPLLLEHIKESFKNASLCILLCWEFKKYNVAYYFFSLTIPYII